MKNYQNLYSRTWPEWAGAFYCSFSRPLFVASLGFILSGSMTGEHKVIRFFLAGEFWSPWG